MSIHLNIDGIKGESSDKAHRGWIDIIQLSFGSGRKITSNTSTQNDRESANAEISDLTFTKHVDSATPKLFLETCCGRGQTMTIELTRTGSGVGSDTYMRYILHNALLRDYCLAGWSQDDERAIEKIKLSFQKLEVCYIPHDEDNKPLAQIAVGFDTTTNEIA